jgi:hypothetical protein
MIYPPTEGCFTVQTNQDDNIIYHCDYIWIAIVKIKKILYILLYILCIYNTHTHNIPLMNSLRNNKTSYYSRLYKYQNLLFFILHMARSTYLFESRSKIFDLIVERLMLNVSRKTEHHNLNTANWIYIQLTSFLLSNAWLTNDK